MNYTDKSFQFPTQSTSSFCKLHVTKFEMNAYRMYEKKMVNLSQCLINEALFHEHIWTSGVIAPHFLTSALHGGMVSFMPLPIYPRGNSPRNPLDRTVGGPQNQSGRCGKEKNLSLPGIETGSSSP
jgi:hypothetical protein